MKTSIALNYPTSQQPAITGIFDPRSLKYLGRFSPFCVWIQRITYYIKAQHKWKSSTVGLQWLNSKGSNSTSLKIEAIQHQGNNRYTAILLTWRYIRKDPCGRLELSDRFWITCNEFLVFFDQIFHNRRHCCFWHHRNSANQRTHYTCSSQSRRRLQLLLRPWKYFYRAKLGKGSNRLK